MTQLFEIEFNEEGVAELYLEKSAIYREEEAASLSIAKWELVVAFYEEHSDGLLECGGRFSCALCRMYIYDKCVNCPVAQATGYTHCENTPYDDYVEAIERDDPEAAYEAAIEELAFLRSLRP